MNVRFYLSHGIEITQKSQYGVKTSRFCHLLGNVIMESVH